MEYGEYATVADVRTTYLGSSRSVDDKLLLKLIRQVTTEITAICSRTFYPVYATKTYDTPKGIDLFLDADLMQLISVTNGDGQLLDITKIVQYPHNSPVTNKLRLPLQYSNWKNNSLGYPDGAIKVEGIWSDVHDPTCGWQVADVTQEILTQGSSIVRATTGVFSAGDIIKIEDEFMYVQSVTNVVIPANPDALPDPIEEQIYDNLFVIRGINGTTDVEHMSNIDIFVWIIDHSINLLTMTAAVGYYNLKSNPMASSTTVDGVTYETPKDVAKFIRQRLGEITLLRTAFA